MAAMRVEGSGGCEDESVADEEKKKPKTLERRQTLSLKKVHGLKFEGVNLLFFDCYHRLLIANNIELKY